MRTTDILDATDMHEDDPSRFIRKPTEGKGMGLFAHRAFREGETVFLLHGTPLSEEDVDARADIRDDDPLQIGEDLFLILDLPSYLFNHSCDPNLGVRGVSELFALRPIGSGEELSYDYSTTVGTDVTWSMECRCGVPECRKVISNALSLPEKRRVYYCARGAFPDFLKEKLCKES